MSRLSPLGRAAIALLLASGAAPSCAAPAGGAAGPDPATAETALAERLYLGRSVPDGGTVTEEAWRAFLDQVVTPRFPEGLTVWRAEGRWRDASGTVVEEAVFVLEIVHAGSAAAERAIEEIAAAYRDRFRQESVMRVTTPVRWRFR